MVLSDSKIANELAYGDLEVEPVDLQTQLQPASLDVRLGDTFIEYDGPDHVIFDVTDDKHEEYGNKFTAHGGVTIERGHFYLADTVELIDMPDYLLGRLEGRSSIGRLGIEVHSTAGIVDPGYTGSITLEITNNNPVPVRLYPQMRIGQLTFEEVDGRVNQTYNNERNKYQGEEEPVPSRIQQDV